MEGRELTTKLTVTCGCLRNTLEIVTKSETRETRPWIRVFKNETTNQCTVSFGGVGKHAATPLVAGECHLECGGAKLGLDDVVEAVLETKAEVLIRPGASAALGDAAQKVADAAAAAHADAEAARACAEPRLFLSFFKELSFSLSLSLCGTYI